MFRKLSPDLQNGKRLFNFYLHEEYTCLGMSKNFGAISITRVAFNVFDINCINWNIAMLSIEVNSLLRYVYLK